MNNTILKKDSDGTILISVEFLEDGYILKNNDSIVRRYELDLTVRSDISCDQFLAAIYSGLRGILVERFHMDPADDQFCTVHKDRLTAMEDRLAALEDRESYLRPRAARELRLRNSALKYVGMRRKWVNPNHRYPQLGQDQQPKTAQELDRQGFLHSFHIFMECYNAYDIGYPGQHARNAQMLLSEEFRCYPVIVRGVVNFREIENRLDYDDSSVPMLPLEKRSHGSSTLRELGFLNGSRLIFDPVNWTQNAILFDEREMKKDLKTAPPQFNLSNQPILISEERSVMLPAPMEQPSRGPMSLAPVVLPTLVTSGAVVGAWAAAGMAAAPEQLLLLAGTLVASSATSAAINRRILNNTYIQEQKKWIGAYQNELHEKLQELVRLQKQDVDDLLLRYPAAIDGTDCDLVHRTVRLDGGIYSRRPAHEDHLQARLGVTTPNSRLVRSRHRIEDMTESSVYTGIRYKNLHPGSIGQFQLELSDGKAVVGGDDLSCGELSSLGRAVEELFGGLTGAPVMLDLRRTKIAALVSREQGMFDSFVANLLLDLCFHHLPEHLQIVMLCKEHEDFQQRQLVIERYKQLPHFRNLLTDRSAFAFNKRDAWEILDRVECSAKHPASERPHLLVLASEDYDLQDHSLWRRATSPDGEGLTILLCRQIPQEVPECCSQMILANSSHAWYLLPGASQLDRGTDPDDVYSRYAFQPDTLAHLEADLRRNRDHDPFYKAFKTLGALIYHRDRQSLVPTYQEFFRLPPQFETDPSAGDLVDACKEKSDLELAQTLKQYWTAVLHRSWSSANKETLSVFIGTNQLGAPAPLDLRETSDGAHLLITGIHGTGKTASATTLMLRLAICLPPDQLSLWMVDLGGTGVSKRLRDLPNARTYLTNPENDGAALVSQVRHLLWELDQEVLQRRLRLTRAGVHNMDEYIRNGSPLGVIPHLFLVWDHFDELLQIVNSTQTQNQPLDLDAELIRLIDSSEGLGIHLVLLSCLTGLSKNLRIQDHIPARLCMELASEELSERLLGTPMAAQQSMVPGRAYLRRSGSSYAEPLQIAYSGADIASRRYGPFCVKMVWPGGELMPFFDSEHYNAPADGTVDTFWTTYGSDFSASKPEDRFQAMKEHWRQTAQKTEEAYRQTAAHTSYAEPQRHEMPTEKDSRTPPEQTPKAHTGGDRAPDWWSPPEQTPKVHTGGDRAPDWWTPPRQTPKAHTGGDRAPDWWSPPEQTPKAHTGGDRAPDWWSPPGQTPKAHTGGDRAPDWWSLPEQTPKVHTGGDRAPDWWTPPGQTPKAHTGGDRAPDWWSPPEQTPKAHTGGDQVPHWWKPPEQKTEDNRSGRIRMSGRDTEPKIKAHFEHKPYVRGERHFRQQEERRAPVRTQLPRVDKILRERKATGISQEAFLVKVLCDQAMHTP